MCWKASVAIFGASGANSEEEHFDLITYLATHPAVGDEIVGTGGVRKVRYGAMGRGKSGGVRVKSWVGFFRQADK